MLSEAAQPSNLDTQFKTNICEFYKVVWVCVLKYVNTYSNLFLKDISLKRNVFSLIFLTCWEYESTVSEIWKPCENSLHVQSCCVELYTEF